VGLLRGELLGGPVCSDQGAFNCHAVTASRWSAPLGLPLALWGMLGYAAVLALALLARQGGAWEARALRLIAALAVVFVCADVALFGLMVFVIRALCVFCLLTYLLNLTLLVVALAALPAPRGAALRQVPAAAASLLRPAPEGPGAMFWALSLVSVAAVAGLHLSTTFAAHGTLAGRRQQLREFLANQPRVSLKTSESPRVGSASAPLQLAEFSDFLCPACQRASKMNRIILAGHRANASFVFKHYPLDTACNPSLPRMVHPGACQIAAASMCAQEQGRFWEFHDLIFEEGHEYRVERLEGDAQRLGMNLERFRECLRAGRGMEAVRRDIAEGQSIGVGSTPTYIINGVRVPSGLTPAVFEDIVALLRERS
jgi:protein-disulfide isomerase